ncbi:MAG: hypothetical protein JST21_00215 [Bacteroidetes bacterium]|nr:hypothetical protein [Bacteroidota bacterium]
MRAVGLALLITTFFIFSASAQAPYQKALGVKFPGGLSLTYKQFISDTHNLEAQFTAWNKGVRVAGLYEFNFYSFNDVPELSWFVGGGAHLGFWKSDYQKNYNSQIDVGVDGIIGLDYAFKKLPLNLSVDWEPAVTLVGNAGFTPVFGGIAVRYTF